MRKRRKCPECGNPRPRKVVTRPHPKRPQKPTYYKCDTCGAAFKFPNDK